MMTVEDIKAKYWALEIISAQNELDISSLSGSLGCAKIDMNPHQVEAALFALKHPLSNGVILADEVGLGKTIEAGIVLSEYFSRGKTALLVIAPAGLCRQWQAEMQDKFDLPTQIIDAKSYEKALKKEASQDLLTFKGITICSYNCAVQLSGVFSRTEWDLVVIDEAHKLRNFYLGKTKISHSINNTFAGRKKLLLTATPIQNSLMDIFSLVTIIDPNILGNEYSFMENYLYSERHHLDLKERLKEVLHRTLRKDVLEYIKYTNREAMTVVFNPTPAEENLYYDISHYIQHAEASIAPHARALIVLMIRKLMSSSTAAVKGTLEKLLERLIHIEKTGSDIDALERFMFPDLDWSATDTEHPDKEPRRPYRPPRSDSVSIEAEKKFLQHLIDQAAAIPVDGKTTHLVQAIEQGFEKIKEKGGQRKALIFTESNRTLNYLYDYLNTHGFAGKIVTFNGQNDSPLCRQIYQEYAKNHPDALTGLRANDMKKALVEAFADKAELMIATEAAAEGLNLQFCSLLVNYDLPWNPQRIEQRIGRIHRYGQKCDVVIINFINKKNVADVRLYNILQHKFKLFDGVFGASDEILGTLSDGVDFEKAVASIFDLCRTTEEINRAFDALQESIGPKKDAKIEETRQLILDHLGPDIQEKFHVMKKRVENYLDRRKQIFWDLTLIILKKYHPDMFIDEKEKIFGPFREQVFNIYSEMKFAKNFCQILDFTQRDPNEILLPSDRVRRKMEPTPYNPNTDFGKRILSQALAPGEFSGHVRLAPSNHLTTGQKGRLKVSLFSLTRPEEKKYLIATIINDSGGLLPTVGMKDIMDNITGVEEAHETVFQTYADQLHEQNIQKYEKSEKQRIDALLKTETDKLNRWLIDEKQAIGLKAEKMKNKLTALKRQFKMEKNFDAKLALKSEIKKLESQMNSDEFNTFDTEKELEKKCAHLIGGKKRALKPVYTITPVFNLTWEVE